MISDFGTPIQTLLDVKSIWLAGTSFNQIVSWRFDWSLPQLANNKFRSREVKGSSIGILTDRSLVKMYQQQCALGLKKRVSANAEKIRVGR